MKLIAAALAALLPCLAAGPEMDKGKTLGNPRAPVLIEIYSDFLCPACKAFHENTLPLLMKDFVTSGKVCIVSREFPLNITGHQHSREAAGIATAAARIGMYDAVANALFRTQESWEVSGKAWETAAAVLTADQQKKVQALAKDPAVLKEVQDDVAYGTAIGIGQTPTLFLSRGSTRYPVFGSALSYNLLKSMINDLLK